MGGLPLDPKNGLLTRTGAAAAGAIALFLGIAALGWKAHDVVQPQGAPDVVKRLDKLDSDMLLIKCRLGIENICPAPPPVRLSGPGVPP